MVVFTHQPFYSMLLFLNDDNESVESLYYPLYAAILFYWFLPNRLYKVCPQWTVPDTLKSIDLTVTFLVEHRVRPLLLVEIKPPSAFHEDGKRGDAIRQVMIRLDEVGPHNVYPRLYAISAIGKRWMACYSVGSNGSRRGRSVRGIAEESSLRSARAECWNPDVTSDVSWEALRRIVETIRSYVE